MQSRKSPHYQLFGFRFYAAASFIFLIALSLVQLPINLVSAQISSTEEVSQQIYQKLPNIPLENQYISRETGKAAEKNTLVARLVRYHLFVKGRSPLSRLDWKLTLADYLGANEFQEESQYPGFDTLKTNALNGDRAAIDRLSRAERDRLIAALLDSLGKAAFNNTLPSTSASPEVPAPKPAPILPQPGDARFLKP